ncbi:hypothetical protein HELRODRAFT_75751, partial [Helobdella robusta]|uniref:Uncharacterized protein n=1 Tax=Helobdella robusta TaxID=6412 RepID=T1G297_HELRO
CLDKEYACRHGRCVSTLFLCDKINDCPQKDDEGERVCGKCQYNEYRCKGSTLKCIPNTQVCDSKLDCSLGDDEELCACLDKEYACKRGRCVSTLFLCDKVNDCPQRDDEGERVCGKCHYDEYRCRGRRLRCIPNVKVCDYTPDCEQGDDEQQCGKLFIIAVIEPNF